MDALSKAVLHAQLAMIARSEACKGSARLRETLHELSAKLSLMAYCARDGSCFHSR